MGVLGGVQFYHEFVKHAQDYPLYIYPDDAQPYATQAWSEQLRHHSNRLFCESPSTAGVTFHEIFRPDEGFVSVTASDLEQLETHLLHPLKQARPDPRCRYIFVHARHGRTNLTVTKAMFLQIATYHRIMPAFLEYVFPFGVQSDRRDAYGGSFRTESHISNEDRADSVTRLGRSGRQLEYCYGLQAVERSGNSRRPWSVRMCAVWHSFDLERERQAWIIIKANKLIADALQVRAGKLNADTNEGDSLARALRLSIATNIEIAKWSAHNWNWYLNSLEEKLREKTQSTLSVRVSNPGQSTTSVVDNLSRTTTLNDETFTTDESGSPNTKTNRWSYRTPFRKSSMIETQVEYDFDSLETPPEPVQPQFSFDNLQQIQTLEEKANDVLMITTSNKQVLSQLRQEYRSLVDSEDCPDELSRNCEPDVKRFERTLCSLEAEFEVLQSRGRTFLKLLQERKALLYGILQYQNMKANMLVSEKAQISTQKMEVLTEQMHSIAEKTQTETVSMRIITVVTLFFLPGTFISTLMSTPIVTFEGGARRLSDRNISVGALQFYCAVSVPLMAFTFAFWYLTHWWEKRKQKFRTIEFNAKLHGDSTAR